MKNYKIIITTIILGAIGSGVWQYVIAPVLSKTSNVILSVATLGIESYKDALYENIAKGFHEYASYSILYFMNVIIVITFVYIVFDLKKRVQGTLDERNKLLKDLDDMESPDESNDNNHRSIAQIRDDLNMINVNGTMRSIKIMIPIVILWGSAQFVTSYSKLYENRAITHFQQSKSIISPYVTAPELLKINSDFSSIKTAEQFYSVISRLNSIAVTNNTELPEFEPW